MFEGNKTGFVNYKKTIICLKISVSVLSLCFGLLGFFIILHKNSVRFGQSSTDVNNVVRVGLDISKDTDNVKSLLRSYKDKEIRFPPSSFYDHSKIFRNSGKGSAFGTVMSEFACRVLSRHVTNSNVLVVAPDAVATAKEAFGQKRIKQTNVGNNRRKYSVGGKFLQYGVSEGHTIHAINSFHDESKMGMRESGPTLDAWWKSFDEKNEPDNTSKWWWSMKTLKPNWILLAVFDSNFGSENSVWKEAETFLENSTVTYIVVAMHSTKLNNGSYKFGGIDAIESLLHKKYKLQTLSSSHYHANESNEREIFEKYGPNALHQSVEQIEDFLRWGADIANDYRESSDSIFTTYIFGTQGLDLAIPTPQAYLREGSKAINVFNKYQMNNLPSLKSCPGSETSKLDFVFDETGLHFNTSKNNSILHSQGERRDKSKENFDVWMNEVSLSKSEAVCVRNRLRSSRCKTRILEKQIFNNKNSSNNTKPNLLLVLLDPISRSHFDRSMPETSVLLEKLDFVKFERYTAVGPNSGPNQAALYSGIELKHREQLHKNLDNENKWLWDRLRESGYITLKGEDSCIENSNMMQSLAPNTTHGSALQGLFCFDAFSRPNCIGPDLASSILFDYGYQFISTYERLRRSTHPDLRWASFMHFVDSHEDTMLLSATLDSGLSMFLKKLKAESYFENSVVILCSDHGLHYGPSFPSLQGRKEATEPILYVHIPHFLQQRVDIDVLKSNSDLWTTPFDLHETLLELTQTSSSRKHSPRKGLTLTERLPASRKECETTSDLIPSTYCDLQWTQEENSNGFCRRPLTKPSIGSFFLDIPLINRRPLMNVDTECRNAKQELTEVNKFDLCHQQSTI